MVRAVLLGGLIAAGSVWTAEPAQAQWGYYGPAYGGTSFSFGFTTGPRYSTYYAPVYSTHYAPVYGYSYPVGPTYYGTSYGYTTHRPYYGGFRSAPRGRLKYDVYTPYGRSEVKYRFYRDGRVRVDIDD